jgi:hypothetical protein
MDKNVSILAPRSWVDSLGTTVSIACAIQCSVFPAAHRRVTAFRFGFSLG